MSIWTKCEPDGGWESFAHSEALTTELWQLLRDEEWFYLNLTRGSSVWESRACGSSVVVGYDESDRIVEFLAEEGAAVEAITPSAARFHLVAHVV